MYGSLDISAGGMVAQRIRLEAISANIANRDAIFDDAGNVNPYRRRQVLLSQGDPAAMTPEGRKLGVHVAEIALDRSAPSHRYDPDNPFAYKDGQLAGYVPTTGINLVIEQIDAMEAARAYEANVEAANTTKTMMVQALRLIA
ncbi:MAG: flagellar basal body rod protein FlgC [Phycisphaerales bacterium]